MMMISNLTPKAIDGVLNLHMNHIAQDDLLIGQWSAPRLGRDNKFYRSALTPHSGLSFPILKKEALIVDVDFSKVAPSLMIKINEREFSVPGHRFQKEIAANDVRVGENTISFLFSDGDRIDVRQIKIHPKRFQKLAERIVLGSDFLTPVQFRFFCNPQQGARLGLSFIFRGQRPIYGKVTVKSENNVKEYVQSIESRQKFQISLLDESLHSITIEIPEINSPFLRLTESQLIEQRGRTSSLSKLREIAKDKNILVILLDAARADHMSCYGYHRQTTPHIDRLSESGYRFDNVFAEAAYTLASTGTLLTGLPPDVHGVVSAFYSSLRDDIVTLPELLRDKGYLTAALSSNPFFSSAYNYHQGFDHFVELFDERKVVNGEDFVAPFEKLVTEARKKPFFMYLHLREPHTPYSMPRPYFGKYQKNFECPSDAYYKEIKRILSAESRSPSELQFMTDVYDENLAYADHIVGKFVEALQKTHQFDETITIIISDHGEGLGEHELLGHNVILHREGIQVPLIFRLPMKSKRQSVVDKPAITSDLTVTLCELLDIDYPYPDISRGLNLFFLPAKRTRICRSTVMSSRYSGYVVDSFPYRAIMFPKLGQLNTQVFDVNEDSEATQALPNGDFQKAALEFFLSRFIEDTSKGFRAGEKPKLGDKEKERLKALGYIK